MEDAERERLERILEAITLAGNADQVREEIAELLKSLPRKRRRSKAVWQRGEAVDTFGQIMQDEGFFDRPDQRLLIFTEFKDTLELPDGTAA